MPYFCGLKTSPIFRFMKKLQFAFIFLLLFQLGKMNAQERPSTERPLQTKIKITGNIIDKTSQLPLEYATISFTNPTNSKTLAGGITDDKGAFNVEIASGVYDIKVEFISFKNLEIKGKNLQENTNLGQLFLAEDAAQLNEVVVRAEKSLVEIKLDKKVYSIGKDLMVKGGTISDVLENVPSVTVDQDGIVSLRGNENVRILVDGKPTNASNIAEVLRTISAESIDKVEVVTNPSARYDSEGTAGILNIILKKGKNQGINGSITGTLGDPKNSSISANVNYKTKTANFYTILGATDRENPGSSITNSQYLNPDGSTYKYIDENTDRQRNRNGYNSLLGMDWDIKDDLNWTNTISYRKSSGESPQTTSYTNFDANRNYLSTDYRYTYGDNNSEEFEYSTNLIKKFKKDGHTLTFQGRVSNDIDDDFTNILSTTNEQTKNLETQNRNLLQLDYVLPINETDQFEAGYKGDFNNLLSKNSIDSLDVNGNYIPDSAVKNNFQYEENINAFYAQYGKKYKKFSGLFGIRWEASNLRINELIAQDLNHKTYNNFFPSAILNYEISDESNAGISYTRRINRPRGRFINPFTDYVSNINIFRGNPILDPATTDAINLQYYKKWGKLTFDTSLYYNITSDVFQFIRLETGRYVYTINGGEDIYDNNGDLISVVDEPDSKTPVILTTPINLSKEFRLGYEFTLIYTPFKWWRLNGNFNIFSNVSKGDYSYISFDGKEVNQSFDRNAYGWFTRLNSRFTLPYNVDFVVNTSYNGAQKTLQGTSKGVFGANVSLTKDFLKDKATVALNVQDVFNSRKRINDTFIPGVLNSYSEMQWRQRQINLSLTYRFNKKKGEKDKLPKSGGDDGGGDFPG